MSLHFIVLIHFKEYWFYFCASEASKCMVTFSLELIIMFTVHTTTLHLLLISLNTGTGELSVNNWEKNDTYLKKALLNQKVIKNLEK